MSSGADDSTLDDVSGIGERRRVAHGLWMRRITVVILAALLVTGGSGYLGVMTATATAQGDGYRVDVTYARIDRAGLDAPLTIRVRAPQPIRKGVVLGISAAYFRLFASPGVSPEPSSVEADATTVYFTFLPPPSGNVLVVAFDASVKPATQQGRSTSIRVQIDGTWRVSTPVNTTLIP